jgi:PTH2 family peptidyl-tRNA hydrolase
MEKDDYNIDMENDYVKQVIVIRKDLKMRKGKMCAQAAHAAMKVVLDRMLCTEFKKESTPFEGCFVWQMTIFESEPMHRWLKGAFTKVVVSVDTEEDLLALKYRAEEAGMLNALITDAGKTEFHGIRTRTALAIGPEWASKLDKITGDLKLL